MKLHDYINSIPAEFSSRKPVLKIVKRNGVKTVSVPAIIVPDTKYEYKLVEIPYNKYNYGDIVDVLIKFIYADKQMFAIINNYLLDPNDETAKSEFDEMQIVRKEAKEIAKEILANYPLN